MYWEHAVPHFAENIFADKFHVTADVPELLTDIEVLFLSFFSREVKLKPFTAIVCHNSFIVGESSLGFFIVPPPNLDGLMRFDLVILIKVVKTLPVSFKESLVREVGHHLFQIKLLFRLNVEDFLTNIA